MSLTDIMSHSGLVGFAEVALVVSFLAFTCVVAWAMLRPRDEMEAEARRPLEDDEMDDRLADAAGKGRGA